MRRTLALVLAASAAACSPSSREDCIAQATKAPTDLGVRVAVAQCWEKFPNKFDAFGYEQASPARSVASAPAAQPATRTTDEAPSLGIKVVGVVLATCLVILAVDGALRVAGWLLKLLRRK